jgi:hypothetical protein
MRKKFISFAQAKYGTVDRVNAAWLTGFKALEEIVVPSFDQRYAVTDGDFRDPQCNGYVIDYYKCQQATVSELVNGLCRLTKETWPRSCIVGLFYGYFYGGWTVGAQASQFDIKTLFRSPYVDYFSGPYSSRNMFGSGYFRTLADGVSLNGKVWICEHDGGSYLGHVGTVRFPDIPRTESESIARMRRNYMYTLTDAAGQWWYDFGPDNRSGSWSTPAMLAEAKSLLKLSNLKLEQPYTKPAEVLMVYDMEAFNYVRPAKVDKLTVALTQDLSDTLMGTGAAIDRIFLMDLEKVDLSKYRLVIFGNTFMLEEAQRRWIKERVVTKGRSVVFLSGAGYTDGTKNDIAHISDLMGMRIAKADGVKPVVTVTLGGQTNRLDAGGVTSLFKVMDSEARSIGTYASGEVAAVVKRVNGATVYYFGLPPKMDVELFAALIRDAGVRTYVDGAVAQDYVAVGGGVIGVYSVNGGKKTIKPTGGAAFTVSMSPFSAHYFDLCTGNELTSDL